MQGTRPQSPILKGVKDLYITEQDMPGTRPQSPILKGVKGLYITELVLIGKKSIATWHYKCRTYHYRQSAVIVSVALATESLCRCQH